MTGGIDGVVNIAKAKPRKVAAVEARVIYVTITSADATPSLVARVDDGTGILDAVFMGRRDVPGIEPGRTIKLAGRIVSSPDAPRMYNPRYELEENA